MMMRNRQQQPPPQGERRGNPNPALLQTTKTVFVANIPFDVTEEQLTAIFAEVGPVQEFVLKFDPNTGKAKGFGFCHYFDHETALSAVRNLQEVVVNGRNLRVELSTDEPYKPRDGRGPPGPGAGSGPGGPGPMGIGMGMNAPRPGMPPPPGVNMNMLPPGQDVPPGQKATDVISKTLASIPPGKLEDVLTGMKTLVQTSPDQARTVLNAHPQLAYALFQAMLLMNVVDPAVLSRIQPIPNSIPPPTQPPFRPMGYQPPPQFNAPPQQQQQPPPQTMPPFAPTAGRPPQGYTGTPPQHGMPPGGGGYQQPPQQQQQYQQPPPPQQQSQQPPQQMQPPPQQPPAVPPPAAQPPAGANQAAIQAALSMVSEDQRGMLMQVFQLTNEQIGALPPDQRVGVMQLRSQFGIN
ncbi:hypothetical protein NCC49_003068 [Naganishia albida]|nr:hypothetical protein NCC49_003068 [Naganishia albida]